MNHPWRVNEEDIPDDPHTQQQLRTTLAAGTLLWGLTIGGGVVLVSTDLTNVTAAQGVMLSGTALAVALVALLLGWLASKLLRFVPFVGPITLGLGLFGLLLVLGPELLTVVFENVAAFEEVPTDDERLLELLTAVAG